MSEQPRQHREDNTHGSGTAHRAQRKEQTQQASATKFDLETWRRSRIFWRRVDGDGLKST